MDSEPILSVDKDKGGSDEPPSESPPCNGGLGSRIERME
jgi:hypothetical protein